MPDARRPLPRHIWPVRIGLDRDGQLTLDRIALDDLARRFGTPLYVYDAATVRAALAAYRRAFGAYAPVRVGYSVKACGLLGILALLGRGYASVASLGELEAALAAGFAGARSWLHGNAKTAEELRGALALGVGRVVVDGEAEVARLAALVGGKPQDVWLRVAPAIAADTGAHLATGGRDQKFGLPLERGVALDVARRIAETRALRLVGLHAHIGSQVRELAAFAAVAEALVGFARTLRDALGVTVRELCVGGGLFAPQTRDDVAPDLAAYARAVAEPIRRAADLGRVRIVVEPGRSIVGCAGIALYRVLERKAVPGARTFVAVDGGMGDNIRPVLYGARYEAVLAARSRAAADERVAVAGAYCEAGDLLISEVDLPRARVGELLAMPAVGAYAVAMASNYNHRPRPAVVLVDRGRATLIRRRERTLDLLRAERDALRDFPQEAHGRARVVSALGGARARAASAGPAGRRSRGG